MFREIVVAGGMFVASFFAAIKITLAGPEDETHPSPMPYFGASHSGASTQERPSRSELKKNLLELLTKSFIRKDMAACSGDPCNFEKEVKQFCTYVLCGLYKSLWNDAWLARAQCRVISNEISPQEDKNSDSGGERELYAMAKILHLERGYRDEKEKEMLEKFQRLLDQDLPVLTGFLLNQSYLDPNLDLKSVEVLRKQVAMVGNGSSLLKETIGQAFKRKEIQLKGLSCILKHKENEFDKEFFMCLKNILEDGELFQDKFIDIFWKTFVEKSYAFALFKFFGSYVPLSNVEMAYGVEAFKFFGARKTFKTWEMDRLYVLEGYIDEILEKRYLILHTALMETPGNKGDEVGDFFDRMTKKWGSTKDAVAEEWSRRCSDPWYWKIEPCFNKEEEKKIFDELNESEEQVKNDGCELKKRTSKVTSKPISTQRDFPKKPMALPPGWKITSGIKETGVSGVSLVPEVSLTYEF